MIHNMVIETNKKISIFATYNNLSKKLEKLKLRVIKFPDYYKYEDQLACLLFDLEHFPINQILNRFIKEGGIVLDFRH